MLPIIYSDEFLLHETGYFHPEKPERLTAIKSAVGCTLGKSTRLANSDRDRAPSRHGRD